MLSNVRTRCKAMSNIAYRRSHSALITCLL